MRCKLSTGRIVGLRLKIHDFNHIISGLFVAIIPLDAQWYGSAKLITVMVNRDPEQNFEDLWNRFHNRYPFFRLRNVDWNKQYKTFRPKVTSETSDDELFDIFCQMLDPLNDGHVELTLKKAKGRKERFYTPEEKPRFYREFSDKEIKKLFKTTVKTLGANGFSEPNETEAWMLHYCRSRAFGYIRILELEGIKKRKLTAALDRIARDFAKLDGFIIDIRDCPGGDDNTAIQIINRFCDTRRVAFHRRTKTGPGEDDFSALKTWHIEPEGDTQFTGPIVLLTCDSVFSGGEVFALAIKELPHVTIIGDHTNGISSYTLDKKLPNGWRYCLSYQKYFSADMVCFEGKGVPVDIELLNMKVDIEKGIDPLITRALESLQLTLVLCSDTPL
jgi:carboxyl-terminal processing protease